ncbi:sigma factor-like helix-turn-helix DNA-binding protein [Lentzea sp. NPDC042327]|uniref:RNA polymerase sigma factor n=1 Tax=Lentzea sp. NPDC042327 TaxID=3154801 RepID=UPI0033E0C9D0
MADVHAGRSRQPGRSGDEALVTVLAEDDFAGPRYRLFERSLAQYAFPVMMTLIREGRIFRECADKGRPLPASPELLVHMATSLETAQQLAGTTVAEALPVFRESAMVGSGWQAAGGASLRSYFVGACVLTFPNIYRKWFTAFLEEERQSRYGLVPDDHIVRGAAPDPADVVVASAFIEVPLGLLPPDTAQALRLIAYEGASCREAARAVGLTENALQKRLMRLRESEAWRDLERGNR